MQISPVNHHQVPKNIKKVAAAVMLSAGILAGASAVNKSEEKDVQKYSTNSIQFVDSFSSSTKNKDFETSTNIIDFESQKDVDKGVNVVDKVEYKPGIFILKDIYKNLKSKHNDMGFKINLAVGTLFAMGLTAFTGFFAVNSVLDLFGLNHVRFFGD